VTEPRHSRQARLEGVGDEGQARIERASAVVRGEGLAAFVEARYLAGAGVKRIAFASDAAMRAARAVDPRIAAALAFPSDMTDDAPDFGVRDPAARDVVTGAWRALETVRKALEKPEP
jgi:hypothetical protein